jgi:hypothetical protein
MSLPVDPAPGQSSREQPDRSNMSFQTGLNGSKDKDANGKGKRDVVVAETPIWFGWLVPTTNRRRNDWHVVLEKTKALGKSQYETIFTIVSSQSSSKGVVVVVVVVVVIIIVVMVTPKL